MRYLLVLLLLVLISCDGRPLNIEHNIKYLVSSIPLTFTHPVNQLVVVNSKEVESILNNSKKVIQK